jgi:hypothetical protein
MSEIGQACHSPHDIKGDIHTCHINPKTSQQTPGQSCSTNISKAIGAHIANHKALKPGPKTSKQDTGRVAAAKISEASGAPSADHIPNSMPLIHVFLFAFNMKGEKAAAATQNLYGQQINHSQTTPETLQQRVH